MGTVSEPRKSKDEYGVIARAEELREYFGLNKGQFSGLLDMKPQTYNNFVGAQGSKPSAKLIFGIARTFKRFQGKTLNLEWFIHGEGEMFMP